MIMWSTLQRFSVKISFCHRIPQTTPIFLKLLDFFLGHFSFNHSRSNLILILALSKIPLDSIRAVINGSGMDHHGHLGWTVSGFGIDSGFLYFVDQVITIHFHSCTLVDMTWFSKILPSRLLVLAMVKIFWFFPFLIPSFDSIRNVATKSCRFKREILTQCHFTFFKFLFDK